MRRASCSLRRQPSFWVARARAPLRWLSLGRRRSTRAFRARTPCRAGCGRLRHRERALHRRNASLLRCKTVVRRATCGLQSTAGFCAAHARAPLRFLSLGRAEAGNGRGVWLKVSWGALFSIWGSSALQAGACYWNGVGGFVFDSPTRFSNGLWMPHSARAKPRHLFRVVTYQQ